LQQRQHRSQTAPIAHRNQQHRALAGEGSYRGGDPFWTKEGLITWTFLAKLAPFIADPIQQFDGSSFALRG